MFSFAANHVFSFTPRCRAANIPAAARSAPDIVHVHSKHPRPSIQLEELPPLTRNHKKAADENQHCCVQQEPERKLRKSSQPREMKFSHSIQFNAVPDWSSHYIAYSNLKKL